jgi:hypothetical protein
VGQSGAKGRTKYMDGKNAEHTIVEVRLYILIECNYYSLLW